MKKTTLLCSLLMLVIFAGAQKPPKTLDDLKNFIGLSTSGLEKQMKKLGYVYQGKDMDDKMGPFTSKMFDADTDDDNWHDIYPICDKETVVGVTFEDFTEADYSKILDYMRANGYKKTVDEKTVVNIGLERVDLWVSGDKKWQVKVDYTILLDERNLTSITLSTSTIDWRLD